MAERNGREVRVYDAETGKLKRIELATPYQGTKTKVPKVIWRAKEG